MTYVEYKNLKKTLNPPSRKGTGGTGGRGREIKTICCIDPGTRNTGIFILEVENRTPLYYDVISLGETPDQQIKALGEVMTMGVDLFLVERQIATNSKAVRLSVVIVTFLLMNFPNSIVAEVPSTLKLGKERGEGGRRDTKKICILKAEQIMNDTPSYKGMKEFVDKRKKKDDISDVICYAEETIKEILV